MQEAQAFFCKKCILHEFASLHIDFQHGMQRAAAL